MTHPPTNLPDLNKPRQMRLLSIDGGGVRGLASILILKRFMNKINEDRAEGLRPYEVFDLIGGIGTGG
jgi:patatin-like phospholipase/acyl hydrolase